MELEKNDPNFRNLKSSKTDQIRSVPEEIIEQILLRLPVKSLLKFRCVSKSWKNLIATKQFIKTHLENSTKNPNFTRHSIICLDIYPPHQTLMLNLHSLLNEQVIDTFEFNDPIDTRIDSIRLVGCCDGLICVLVNGKSFFLWNPSMRAHKKLPDVDENIKHGLLMKYGFGFDESNGDYKVFVVMSVFWHSGKYESIVKIYSLKSNSWKRLKEKDVEPYLESGKFVSGKLHWPSKFGLNSSFDILSFDLTNEVYGTVEQPTYRDDKCDPILGVLGGCLCVLGDYRKTCTDVWVMKEYGVKESWVVELTVPYPCDPRDGLSSAPFFIGPNGEILYMNGKSFVIYCPKGNFFRRPHRIGFDPFGEVDVYVESLVSLVPDVEEQRQT